MDNLGISSNIVLNNNVTEKSKNIKRANFVPFKDRSITTMVIIAGINAKISIPETFLLLPWTKVDIPEVKKKSKTIQIPHLAVPGSIVSLRCGGETRGLIVRGGSNKKSNGREYFKNSITIDMSISDKNVNLRLSKSTIHICGIKNTEQVHETVNLIFEHLRKINEELIYLRDNNTDIISCMKYIRVNLNVKDGDLLIERPTSGLNLKVFDFLTRNLREHTSAKNYLEETKFLISIISPFKGELTISKIETSMVNLNYDIGFELNRRKLAHILKTKYTDLTIDYDNTINHSVKIKIPFKIPEGMNIRRKKKKDADPSHTFMIYKSGRVTQSGPCLELMEPEYNRFFTIMNEIRDDIDKDVKVKTLRINIITDSNITSGSKSTSLSNLSSPSNKSGGIQSDVIEEFTHELSESENEEEFDEE